MSRFYERHKKTYDSSTEDDICDDDRNDKGSITNEH